MGELKKDSFKRWEGYFKDAAKCNYPKWPNEPMLKVIFGNYLKNKINLSSKSKVLDIGCGFGNNLLPFYDKGCKCFGTEVTEDIAKQTQRILLKRGFDVDIRCGRNTCLPFRDNLFDLLLSVNIIHYEKTAKDITLALKEYNRVLKRGGYFFLMTVGPEHEIQKKAKRIGPHNYLIRNYGFRSGEQFFFFESTEYLKSYLSKFFARVEVGQVTERLMTRNLDFLIAVCKSKK